MQCNHNWTMELVELERIVGVEMSARGVQLFAALHNGSDPAFQAGGTGSIPVGRYYRRENEEESNSSSSSITHY